MIEVTSATLAIRLNKALGLNLRKANLCSGDYLMGKLQEKGLVDSLPAIALERTSLQIDRENRHRVVPGRAYGIIINEDLANKKVDKLKVLPVMMAYSVSVIMGSNDERDKAEADLLWFFEDGEATQLDIPIVVHGIEAVIPASISPSSLQNVSFSLNRKESWEEYKMYRIDFDIEVKSFLVKYESYPVVSHIEYQILKDEIILDEGIVE